MLKNKKLRLDLLEFEKNNLISLLTFRFIVIELLTRKNLNQSAGDQTYLFYCPLQCLGTLQTWIWVSYKNSIVSRPHDSAMGNIEIFSKPFDLSACMGWVRGTLPIHLSYGTTHKSVIGTIHLPS